MRLVYRDASGEALTVSDGAEDAIVLRAEDGPALTHAEARTALRELARDPVLRAISAMLAEPGGPGLAVETLEVPVSGRPVSEPRGEGGP